MSATIRLPIALLSLCAAAGCQPPQNGAAAAPTAAPDATSATPAPTTAELKPESASALTCTYPVDGQKDTAATVLARFGKEAQRTKIAGPEGTEFKGIVLWKDDPRRRIELVIDEESRRERIFTALVRSPSSQWRIKGLGLGVELANVVSVNGAPVTFWGFGWDYGGNVTDLGKGKLAVLSSNCSVSIQLDMAMDGGELPEGLLGEVEISSTDKRLAGRAITVSEIGLNWR